MAKADRLAKLDDARIALEAEYLELLIIALKETAAGRRGLFEHKKDKGVREKAAPMIDAIDELGADINRMRETLDIEPFPLHREFELSRGPVKSSAVGEPKQAQAWLEKLGVE